MARVSQVDVPANFSEGYPSFFLTVKDGGDLYVVVPTMNEEAEGLDAYGAAVYMVGASSYERVWTWTGSRAYILYGYIQIFNYALADADGKFAMYGFDFETESGGVYVIDMRGRSATFVGVQELNEGDPFGGYDPYKFLSVRGQIFFVAGRMSGSATNTGIRETYSF